MRGAEHAGGLRFTAAYRPAETGVVWYSFDIEASDGAVWRYGAREGWVTGEGAFAYGDPPSFQITVFSPRAHQPRWYREGIVYQIFPDRFARGEDWRERAADTLAIQRRGGPAREVLEDWDTPPTYRREGDGSVACWDFYGGTLEGIRERLDYLEDLGVTAIYLNPVFEAASNHRYDTADYLRIDPLLGDEQSFRALCVDAEEHGISIILDGVFNHVGADSRYFNRFGTYAEPGAWQGERSRLVHLQRRRHLCRLVGGPKPPVRPLGLRGLPRARVRARRRHPPLAAPGRARLAARRRRRADRRVHRADQARAPRREARRRADRRGLGGRLAQDGLREAAPLLPGSRARRHDELPRAHRAARLRPRRDGRERAGGAPRGAAQELPARQLLLRSQPAGEPRPRAPVHGAGRGARPRPRSRRASARPGASRTTRSASRSRACGSWRCCR